MGGECLCQIYLSTMHEYFSKNPEIEKIKQNLEWEFWNIHIGEIDLHHQTIVKNAISEIILEYPFQSQKALQYFNEHHNIENVQSLFIEKVVSSKLIFSMIDPEIIRKSKLLTLYNKLRKLEN